MTGTAQDDPINRVAVTTAAFNVVVISNVISSLMPQHFGAPTFIETRVRLRLFVFMSALFFCRCSLLFFMKFLPVAVLHRCICDKDQLFVWFDFQQLLRYKLLPCSTFVKSSS